jgi:hypothetical protein
MTWRDGLIQKGKVLEVGGGGSSLLALGGVGFFIQVYKCRLVLENTALSLQKCPFHTNTNTNTNINTRPKIV